jgi:hypothetical protein
VDEEKLNGGVLPTSELEVRMPSGAAPPPVALPAIPAKDVLNMISQRLAHQCATMLNQGLDMKYLVLMHVDHLAGLLALIEPRQRRNADLAEAIKLLERTVREKATLRRSADQAHGIKNGGLRA